MFDLLFNYIESKSGLPLDAKERGLVKTSFGFKRLRKRQYLLQEGEVCKQMGFVLKGAARMYSVDGKGQEHILRLGIEGWWLGDYESFSLQQPTKFFVEVLEDTNLLMVTKDSIQELASIIPAVDKMVKFVDQRSVIATLQRVHALISLTAEERYDALAKSYPDFLQRFPQGMIASYLGVTPETLSRVRKKTVATNGNGLLITKDSALQN